MKKSILAAMLTVVMCFALLAGCANDAEVESDIIKVGYLGPISGDAAKDIAAAYSGVKMYVDELNATGGIRGKKIELVLYDDKGDTPAEAIAGFNQLIEVDKVVCIFSSSATDPTTAVAQESADFIDPVPVITIPETVANITSFGKNFFRICISNSAQGIAMVTFAVETLEAEKISVLYNSSSTYSNALSAAFQTECVSQGAEVASIESYDDDTEDFEPIIETIKEAAPDVIYVPEHAAKAAEIIKILRDGGINATILGCNGWAGILDEAEDTSILENSYFTGDFSVGDPDAESFVTRYEELYGEKPNLYAANGYEAAMVMFDAIKRAGNTERAAIITALGETDLEGITNQLTFENQNATRECSVIKIALNDEGELDYIFDSRI
jgi:ABC-type branched-chain amino acid transport systems, periplasmic component